jgi:hypothetical protein
VAAQGVARRLLTVGVAGAAVFVLAGCAGGDRGATVVQATTSAAATTTIAPVSDEQQIRDMYARGTVAIRALDLDASLAETCQKLQQHTRDQFNALIPPMTAFGSPADLKTAGVDAIVRTLGPKLAPVPEDSIRPLAQALVANDQAAYDPAIRTVIKQGLTYDIAVKNIKVTGDTATAETTTSTKTFTVPASTKTEQAQIVREGGQWKDCTPGD